MQTEKPSREELAAEVKQVLACCTGTETLTRHWTGAIKYTKGIHLLAEKAGAFWLIDAIASHQVSPRIRRNRSLQEFQLWQLKVVSREHAGPDQPMAVLTCRCDSDTPIVVKQDIEHTDFPLDEIKLYVEGGVLLLPSEH